MKLFTSKTQKTGEEGEYLATLFLKEKGFSIIERNVANKFGEIDIVAKRKGKYYFVEVKTDKGGAIRAIENLHPAKMAKFSKSVEYYCLTHREVGEDYAISAITVSLTEGREPKIEFLEQL